MAESNIAISHDILNAFSHSLLILCTSGTGEEEVKGYIKSYPNIIEQTNSKISNSILHIMFAIPQTKTHKMLQIFVDLGIDLNIGMKKFGESILSVLVSKLGARYRTIVNEYFTFGSDFVVDLKDIFDSIRFLIGVGFDVNLGKQTPLHVLIKCIDDEGLNTFYDEVLTLLLDAGAVYVVPPNNVVSKESTRYHRYLIDQNRSRKEIIELKREVASISDKLSVMIDIFSQK